MYQKETRKSNLFRNRSHIFEHVAVRDVVQFFHSFCLSEASFPLTF